MVFVPDKTAISSVGHVYVIGLQQIGTVLIRTQRPTTMGLDLDLAATDLDFTMEILMAMKV